MDQYQVKENDSVINSSKAAKRNENKTAMLIQLIGFLTIIAGLIIGIVLNSIALFLVSGLITGIILIGFGETIRLLHEINERQKERAG